MNDKLLNSQEVADMLRISTKTLANWRYRGRIPYIRVNGVVRYRISDLEKWLSDRQMQMNL